MIYEFIKKDDHYNINHNGKKIGEMHCRAGKLDIWWRGEPTFNIDFNGSITKAIDLCTAILLRRENPVDVRIIDTKADVLKEVEEMMQLACLVKGINYDDKNFKDILSVVDWVRKLIINYGDNFPLGFCPKTGKKL